MWAGSRHRGQILTFTLLCVLHRAAGQPWYFSSVVTPFPDRTYSLFTNTTSTFSMGSTVDWQLQVGVQPMPALPPATGFASGFGLSLQISGTVGPRWALLDLDTGIIAINEPFSGSASTPSFVSAAANSILLLPPAPGTAPLSNDARRYVRTLLTLQYYLIEWSFGFNLDDTGLGSAFGHEVYNTRATEQAKVQPEVFVPLVTYLGAIAQFLLPGVRFFDGVPISQLLVANSTNAMGIVEPNALYGGALGNSSILPSALACAQACFDAAAPFYYCPTQPFDNLEGGSSLEDCPPNKCDSWTYCGQKGGCPRYTTYLQPQAALVNEQFTGFVPLTAGTPTYQPALYILEVEGALSLPAYQTSVAARSGGYGGYASGGIGFGYGYLGSANPQQGAIVSFPKPAKIIPQGTCQFLNVWTEASTFQHYYNEGQFSQLGSDVRGQSIPFTSGRILPYPTGAQEF